MYWSWASTIFAILSVCCVAAAWLVRDRRIHVATFVLVGTWVLAWFGRFFFWRHTPVMVELFLNVALFYIFMQLHFWRIDEKNGPVWPVFLMGCELFIFLSHITKFTFGQVHYVGIINFLFALELAIVTGVAIWYKIRELRSAGTAAGQPTGKRTGGD